MKIWSGKEIKFTQGLSEHAAFWGKFRAMFPKLIKFEQVQKLKDIWRVPSILLTLLSTC